MHWKWLVGSIVLGSALVLGILWGTNIPLGIPGEWTWQRIPVTSEFQLVFCLGLISGLIASAIYFLVVWVGSRRLEVAGRIEVIGWFCCLTLTAFFYLISLQEAPPNNARLTKAPFVLFYPASSGYYTQARSIEKLSQFLAQYETQMTQGDVLHIGTHPPGLILMHYGLLQICENFPAFENMLLQTRVRSVIEASEVIQKQNFTFTSRDAAALWFAALLTQLLAVLTIVPIYLIARIFSSRPVSWFVAALWPTVPALAIFLPKSDAIYPLLAMLFLWSWLYGIQKQSWPHCLAAGVVAWFGLFFSLAMLPILLIGAVIAMIAILSTESVSTEPASVMSRVKQIGFCLCAAICGFLLPVLVCWISWDMNLPKIWLWNYKNHAGFYEQYTRTYWKWLLLNPLELLFSVGAPIVITALFAVQVIRRNSDPASRLFFQVSFGVWGLLWLSGKNMGEAARLWLLLMPLVLLLTLPLIARASATDQQAAHDKSQPDPDPHQHLATPCLYILAIQLLVSLLTVTRITGFDMLVM